METDNSLNRSIDNAKKHYSSMFFLPSLKQALIGVAAICVLIGVLSYAVLPSHGLSGILLVAIPFFGLTVAADLAVSNVILKGDPIFVSRRVFVLSLFTLGIWLVFIAIGAGLSYTFPGLGWQLWAKLCLLGFAAVVTLRTIVFIATSSEPAWRRGLAVLLQPVFCVIVFLFFWAGVSASFTSHIWPFIAVSPIIALIASALFFYPIERLGEKTYSMPSLPMFKAFIVNWVTNDNAPLEGLLEKMGEDTDVEVNVLKFEASSKPKAAVVVSLVHPGPFKNIGSSTLPALMKHNFQKELHCETATPLGVLGHERDLASQAQNQKIITQVTASANFKASSNLASPAVRASEGVASACCQIFGDTALVCFTLSPQTTEDLPQELGQFVSEEAAKYGLKHTIVVNSHNSLTDVIEVEKYLDALKKAASQSLQKAVEQSPSQFMVGAASIYPVEFTLKDGMAAGGITAVVAKVQEQKSVYVVIDGNNMIPSLREKILASLRSAGFEEGEVLTTDTHAVSAIITGHRGYHPVGEAMDNELLIRYIVDTAKKADASMEPANVGCLQLIVPNVRAIGEKRLKSMTALVDKAIQKIRQEAIPIFGIEGLILIILLAFL